MCAHNHNKFSAQPPTSHSTAQKVHLGGFGSGNYVRKEFLVSAKLTTCMYVTEVLGLSGITIIIA